MIEELPRRATLGETPTRASPSLSLFRRPTDAPVAPVPRPVAAGSAQAWRAAPYRALEQPAPAQEQVGIYLPYRPSRIVIPGASAHPTPLVESLAMGSIAAPKPDRCAAPAGARGREGLLSAAQLETLIYAGSRVRARPAGPVRAGRRRLRASSRRTRAATSTAAGYFLGDGTGAGKGRQVAGIILDQWLRGNRRHIWISKNETLLEDARRDWSALGGLPLDIQPLSQWKLGAPIDDGRAASCSSPIRRSARAGPTRPGFEQILDWAATAFDGVIAFDEAHAMANAAGGEGAAAR